MRLHSASYLMVVSTINRQNTLWSGITNAIDIAGICKRCRGLLLVGNAYSVKRILALLLGMLHIRIKCMTLILTTKSQNEHQ
jgi:hypothetical protein